MKINNTVAFKNFLGVGVVQEINGDKAVVVTAQNHSYPITIPLDQLVDLGPFPPKPPLPKLSRVLAEQKTKLLETKALIINYSVNRKGKVRKKKDIMETLSTPQLKAWRRMSTEDWKSASDVECRISSLRALVRKGLLMEEGEKFRRVK